MKKGTVGVLVHFDMRAPALSAEQVNACFDRVLACVMPLCEHAEITSEAKDAAVRRVTLTEPERGVFTAEACIARDHTSNMIGHEQRLLLTIEQKLWTLVQRSLLDCLMSLCMQGDISYIAIDRAAVAPGSIYHANLRLFADKFAAAQMDAEAFIPGIYWVQYLGSGMLTEELRQALRCSGMTVREIGSGMWVQTARTLRSDAAEAHKALYDLIRVNSYEPDMEALEKYRCLQPWLFDRFPI